MRNVIRLLMTATALVTLYGGVLADTCTVGGTTRTCDFVCGFPSFPPGVACTCINQDINGDGVATTCGSTSGPNLIQCLNNNEMICGRDSADSIDGNGGNDQINGGGGNDTIDAGGGDDVVEGGDGADVIEGGSGDDDIYGTSSATSDWPTDDGGNRITAGSGDDLVVGAGGDDEIFGGNGADFFIGQGGRDLMKGEAGNDTIISNYGGSSVNDVLGTLICGGSGDDTITADGPGHQCVDGGTQQAISGSENDCSYFNLPSDSDDHDLGTQRNCINPSGFHSTRHPSCGCD
jgi:Ca2+-binding RTX toxin-like protein